MKTCALVLSDRFSTETCLGGEPLAAYALAQAFDAGCVDTAVLGVPPETESQLSERFGVGRLETSGSGVESLPEFAQRIALLLLEQQPSCELAVLIAPNRPLLRATTVDTQCQRAANEGIDVLVAGASNEDLAAGGQNASSGATDAALVVVRTEWAAKGGIPRMVFSGLSGPEALALRTYEDVAALEPWIPGLGLLPERSLLGCRALVLDFDGVMTDNRVWLDQSGTEWVACSRGDGMGIERVKAAGIDVWVLSKEKNPVVRARCEKLGIQCLHGVDNKLPLLKAWAQERGLDATAVVYVGNDVNDIECLQWAGLGVAVNDAMPQAKNAARRVTARNGGLGAVREVCEWLLASRALAAIS